MHTEQVQEITLHASEMNQIHARAERVCRLMQKAAQHWMEVAEEVHDAKDKLSKDAFIVFLQKSQLTRSIADKLMTIAKTAILYDEQSKPYLKKLEGWTTLYEVAKLPQSDIRVMYDEIDNNPEQQITRSFVRKFKTKMSAKSKLTPIALIALDEADIHRLDYDEFQKIRDDIEAAQRIIDRSSPLVQMRISTKVIERLEALILNSGTEQDDTIPAPPDQHLLDQMLSTNTIDSSNTIS